MIILSWLINIIIHSKKIQKIKINSKINSKKNFKNNLKKFQIKFSFDHSEGGRGFKKYGTIDYQVEHFS